MSQQDHSEPGHTHENDAARDIADVPAIEVINTVAVHLLSAAAVKCGLADNPDTQLDLDEAKADQRPRRPDHRECPRSRRPALAGAPGWAAFRAARVP